MSIVNSSVREVFGRMPKAGMLFGMELELEGHGVNMEGVAAKGWKRTADNSLRGESVEYIFAVPCEMKEAMSRVDALFKKFIEHKVNLKNSYRTSTHVHLNYSDKTVREVVNFFVLFTMLEEILDCYSGEERGGNLFCLSSRHSEEIINIISRCLRKKNFADFAGDAYKYAACNLCTLYKFGSIEIRTMRGANSADQVKSWVEILNDMYEFSCKKMKSPVELIENLSIHGAHGLLDTIFSPKNLRELLRTWPANRDLRQSLLDGARLVQMICYEFAEEFDKEPVKPPVGPAVKMADGRLNLVVGAEFDRLIVYRPNQGQWVLYGKAPNRDTLGHGEPLSDAKNLVYDAIEDRMLDLEKGKHLFWKEHPVWGDERHDFEVWHYWEDMIREQNEEFEEEPEEF